MLSKATKAIVGIVAVGVSPIGLASSWASTSVCSVIAEAKAGTEIAVAGSRRGALEAFYFGCQRVHFGCELAVFGLDLLNFGSELGVVSLQCSHPGLQCRHFCHLRRHLCHCCLELLDCSKALLNGGAIVRRPACTRLHGRRGGRGAATERFLGLGLDSGDNVGVAGDGQQLHCFAKLVVPVVPAKLLPNRHHVDVHELHLADGLVRIVGKVEVDQRVGPPAVCWGGPPVLHVHNDNLVSNAGGGCIAAVGMLRFVDVAAHEEVELLSTFAEVWHLG